MAWRLGFTLVELLLAVAVTALLVTFLLAVTNNVLTVWNRSAGTLTAGNQARLVLDQIARDLEGALFRADGNVWLAATVQDNQSGTGDAGFARAVWTPPAGGTIKPPASAGSLRLPLEVDPRAEDYRFGQAGVWLRLFATPSAQNPTSPTALHQRSAPRAISYQIIRARPTASTAARPAYLFFRAEARPHHHEAATANRGTLVTGHDLFGLNDYNNPPAGAGNIADTGNIRRPRVEQLLATDVVDFGIRFFAPGAAGEPVEVFPVDRRGAAQPVRGLAVSSDPTRLPPPGYASTSHPIVQPTGAEIIIRVLTNEGVRLIDAFEEDPGRFPDQTWWDLVEAHAQVYVRRVTLLGMSAP
jgi:prepilin-type N-terminal cleavage/methylation domain-containing protein